MEAVNICKTYRKKKVLVNLSFTAEKGKCTGFIGANGCGKSTLFRTLAGVEKPDSGSIFLGGKEILKPDKELAEYVGYLPQENALMEDLTVKDQLALYGALCKKQLSADYVKQLYERFALREFERERVSRLSGGMKKRVSIVCALLHQPEILIMDEPSAALDLVFKEELKNYIKEFTGAGGSVLISSHDRGELAQCDKLYAISNGGAVQIPSHLALEDVIAGYIKKNEQVQP